ncbi:tRNA (adenine(58)-N(1))-methyltransferase non-catalytic subunit trm6 [Savitreella phatthalungensis]
MAVATIQSSTTRRTIGTSTDDLPTIAAGHTVLIRLPSNQIKPVILKAGSHSCSLGKFGVFDPQKFVGHPYGLTYEILEDKAVRVLEGQTIKSIEQDEAEDDDEEIVVAEEVELGRTTPNNEFINDENSRNQSLSHEQIAALKDSGDREALIELLKRNSRTFGLKTDFSKDKYMARKRAKYSRRFATIVPSLFEVLEFLSEKEGGLKFPVSAESFGYLLNMADVRPGGTYLVVEDLGGLVTAGVLERGGKVLLVHESEHYNADNLKYFAQYDVDELVRTGRIQSLNWAQAVDAELELQEIVHYIDTHGPIATKRRQREKLGKRRGLHKTLEKFVAGGFDGLICACELPATAVVEALLPRVGLSRKLAVYHAYREPLLELRHAQGLLADSLIAQSIVELRAREIQVIPGRTRPVMTKSAEWGHVFHAIKVLKDDSVEASAAVQSGKRKRKGPRDPQIDLVDDNDEGDKMTGTDPGTETAIKRVRTESDDLTHDKEEREQEHKNIPMATAGESMV